MRDNVKPSWLLAISVGIAYFVLWLVLITVTLVTLGSFINPPEWTYG